MKPLPVVEHLDVLEDLTLGGFPRGETPALKQLPLKRGEKALHHRVVVAVGRADALAAFFRNSRLYMKY